MEKVAKIVDRHLESEVEREIDYCLKKLRGLEYALRIHEENLRELFADGRNGLGERLGIIEGKTGDTVSAMYMIEKTKELLEETIALWGETIQKHVYDYLKGK